MTDSQKKALAKYERAVARRKYWEKWEDIVRRQTREYKALRRAQLREDRLLKKVVEDCPHPELYCRDYLWEHDNGYGTQKWITGSRCTICGSKRSWKNMGLWRKG